MYIYIYIHIYIHTHTQEINKIKNKAISALLEKAGNK